MKIKFTIIILLFASLYFSCGSKKKALRQKYGVEEKEETNKSKHTPTLAEIFAETITMNDLDYHVYNLSDSTMQGRETGTKGADKAARYIWDFFVDQHLYFPKKLDGYYQKYTAAQNDKPEVVLETDRKAYQYGEDFISFFPHDSINIEDNKIIFAGYGIDEYKYNDYAYQDVKNKIVLVVGGEPRDKYGNYIISDEVNPYSGRSRPSVWSQDPIKAYILRRNAAMKHGAKAMLYYDPQNHDYFWKNFKKHFAQKKIEVSVQKDSVYDFFINKDIFTDITGYDRPEDMEYTKKTRKLSVPIKLSYKNRSVITEGKNVMGLLEGDKKSDEYIIILSHYDGQGMHDGKIYPSANDNASGVAASFEIAEAFQAAKDSGFVPKRHLVFINLSGKEQDMLGARFYISHPVFPLEKTVAVIELHKLGRIKESTDGELGDFFPLNISFDGFQRNGFMNKINEIQSYNDYMTIKFKPLIEHSEYFYFMKEHIPIIYFEGGNYNDYHEPTDTPENVSYEVLEKRTRFIFQIIWDLAFQKKL
jgi:hypothetical protein